MKRYWKDKWVKALESGNYKKGKAYLHKSGKYCCLGVLCEIAGYDWLTAYDGPKKVYQPYLESGKHASIAFVPFEICEKVGLKTTEGLLLNGSGDSLACINDKTSGFKIVIEAIKKNWRTL